MEFIFKYTWSIFIVTVLINVLILKLKSKKYIADKPELKQAYDKYL